MKALFFCSLFFAFSFSTAKTPQKKLKTWDDYVNKYDLQCLVPFELVEEPKEIKLNEKKYIFRGFRADVADKDANKEILLGVLSAIKEYTDETIRNVKKFLQWFKKEKVEIIILNGDIAYDELEMTENIKMVAESGLPVYAVIGNSETIGAFNGAVLEVEEKYPNVINGNLVRFLNADDVDIISLPGYFQRRFLHAVGGCLFRAKDVKKLGELVELADDPVAFVSHSPHKQEGKLAIDYAVQGGNVGSLEMSKFIEKYNIPLGIFGYILEAGGKATNFDGKKVIPENKWVKSLYLNGSSVSGTSWEMNEGYTSIGMAAIVWVKNGSFKYKFKKFIEK